MPERETCEQRECVNGCVLFQRIQNLPQLPIIPEIAFSPIPDEILNNVTLFSIWQRAASGIKNTAANNACPDEQVVLERLHDLQLELLKQGLTVVNKVFYTYKNIG